MQLPRSYAVMYILFASRDLSYVEVGWETHKER